VRVVEEAGIFNNLSNSNLDSEETYEIKFTDYHFELWFTETLINLSCISFASALICAGLLWEISYFFILLELVSFDFLNIILLFKKCKKETRLVLFFLDFIVYQEKLFLKKALL